jgi:hypothetical protein
MSFPKYLTKDEKKEIVRQRKLARKRELYLKNKDLNKDKIKKKGLARYEKIKKDPIALEKERARWREKAKKQREQDPDYLAKRREVYARNKCTNAHKQKLRRHKREPNRAIFAATRDLATGRVGLNEYISIVNEALSWTSSEPNIKKIRE